MTIAIISGSARTGSKSREVARLILEKLNDNQGIQTHFLDVAAYAFPPLEERHGILPNPPAGLDDFAQKINASDALIIVTPEYNGGMAGSLKNTLDYFRREFNRKPMAAVTVTSGTMGGVNALHQLWYWMLYVGALVSPTRLMVSEVNTALEQPNSSPGERLHRGMEKMLDDLVWFTGKFAQ